MRKHISLIQKLKKSFLGISPLILLIVFTPCNGYSQNKPKIEVTKKTNTKYGEGGFEKIFLRRNVEIKLVHDNLNNPREEIKYFNYSDGNSKTNTWYFDNKYNLNHFSSYYFNSSKIKIGSVEAFYKNNKLQNAYSEYSEDGISKTAKYNLKNRVFENLDLDFKALESYNWDKKYNNLQRVVVPPPLPISAFIKLKDYAETKKDNSYPGGTLKTIVKGGQPFGDGTEEFYDRNGILRKQVYYEYDPYYDEYYIESTFYDCNGQIEHYTENYRCGDCGVLLEIIEIDFENGHPVSGYRDYESDFDGDWETEEYDPETDSFIDPYAKLRNLKLYFRPPKYIQSLTSCESNILDLKKNNFLIGPALIVEKNGNDNFSLYGGKLTYQRNLSMRLGLYLDADYYMKGKTETGKNTQLGVYGGVAYAPLETASFNDLFSWSLRGFAGVTNFGYKFQNSNNSNSNFTVGLSTGLELNCLKQKTIKGVGVFPIWKLNLTQGNNFSQYGLGIQAKF